MPIDKPVGIFFIDYAWAFFILVTTINAILLKVRTDRIVEENPELEDGYKQLFKGYLIFMNIPWVVMGIGMIFGGVPSTFSFFFPSHGNMFVIAFYAVLVILWLLCIWWVYFKSGAEFLSKYRGVLKRDVSPNFIKAYFGLCLSAGILAFIVIWIL